MSIIGDRIKKRRQELNMSQEDLALKVGYTSRSTINKIEKGINDITQSKIILIANVLKTTPAYLMGWDDEEVTKDNLEYLKKLLEEYDLTLNDFTEQEIRKIVEYSLFLYEQRNRGGSNV